jgi:hypothetical protein
MPVCAALVRPMPLDSEVQWGSYEMCLFCTPEEWHCGVTGPEARCRGSAASIPGKDASHPMRENMGRDPVLKSAAFRGQWGAMEGI